MGNGVEKDFKFVFNDCGKFGKSLMQPIFKTTFISQNKNVSFTIHIRKKALPPNMNSSTAKLSQGKKSPDKVQRSPVFTRAEAGGSLMTSMRSEKGNEGKKRIYGEENNSKKSSSTLSDTS
jgi:hypothetical protein